MPKSEPCAGAPQAELERMNRLYAMLSHINRTIVHSEDPQELYATACRIAVERGGFGLAWIALLEPGSRRTVPVAAAGAATLAQLRQCADAAGDMDPTALAAHDCAPFVANDVAGDPRVERWRDLVGTWGIRAVGSFPIRTGGDPVGAFNVAAMEPGFFKEAELNLMAEVVEDLSFALDVLRQEERRIAAESKMRYLAYYDPQTGMPSRALFEERLAEACREGATVAVLVADLRSYADIVQLLGPAAGQEIVRVTAARIESALPAVPVARLSECRFAVMQSDPAGLDVVEETAWNVRRALAEAIRAEGQDLFLDPFIGITVFPKDGEPSEVLNRAIFAAAASGEPGTYCRFFVADMEGGSRQRLNMGASLHRALERGEFLLHYQPPGRPVQRPRQRRRGAAALASSRVRPGAAERLHTAA